LVNPVNEFELNVIAIIDDVAIILCRIRQPWRYV